MNAAVLKTVDRLHGPGVRIPPSPPYFPYGSVNLYKGNMRLVNRIRTPGIDNAGFTKSPGAILNSAALAELARRVEYRDVRNKSLPLRHISLMEVLTSIREI